MNTALLIECTLKASAVLALAWTATLALRKSSAAARHIIWMAALLSAAVLPLLIALTPDWQALPLTRFRAVATAADAVLPAAATAFTLVNLWLLGAALTLAVFAIAHLRTAALVRRARMDGDLRTTFEPVSPFVWGLANPVIVWPEAANEWPEELRTSVLLHEREHLQRHDFAWILAAQLACALYWFLPLAWFAARKAREESEHACDDAVLRNGISDTGYAEQLLHVARSTTAIAAVPAITGASPMERRMRALLDRTANRAALSRRVVFTAAAVCLAITLPLAALQQDDKIYSLKEDKTLTPPRLVHKVEPQYTEEARDAKIAGTVVLTIVVEKSGVASGIKVLESLDPGLDANAILALQQWQFEPAKKNGEPVRVSATVEVNFRLN